MISRLARLIVWWHLGDRDARPATIVERARTCWDLSRHDWSLVRHAITTMT